MNQNSDILRKQKLTIDLAIKEAANNSIANSVLGKDIAAQIKKRTRLGKGVEENTKRIKNLKPLTSDQYINRRRLARKGNKLSSKTRPSKSNLTFTGVLLDSIASIARRSKIIIFFRENRVDGVKNSDIVEFQRNQGREFFLLSNSELKKFSRNVSERIRKTINIRLRNI